MPKGTSSINIFVPGTYRIYAKIVSEYDQEIPQSQTTDKSLFKNAMLTYPATQEFYFFI